MRHNRLLLASTEMTENKSAELSKLQFEFFARFIHFQQKDFTFLDINFFGFDVVRQIDCCFINQKPGKWQNMN
jgi:hypothetical protein